MALSAAEQALLRQAWAALLAVYVALRLAPLGTVLSAVARVRSPRTVDAATWGFVEAVRAAVQRAAGHHLTRMTCLPQALATQWLLARRGVVSSLQIGVRKHGQEMAAHAWLELDGRPIGEPELIERRFARLVPGGIPAPDDPAG